MNSAYKIIGFASIVLSLAACSSDTPAPTDGGAAGDMTVNTDMGVGTDLGPNVDLGTPIDMSIPVDAGECDPVLADVELSTENIAPGHNFDRPVYVAQAPGIDDALWVVERSGTIQVVQGGEVSLFLDVTPSMGPAPTSMGDERGLLGLAFAPDYTTSRRFFVNYTTTTGAAVNRVAEYHASEGSLYVADATPVRNLVNQTDPQSNHNGGSLVFGSDGFLYVGMGDGGNFDDQGPGHGTIGNGLDLSTLLGKLLRLDIDNEAGEFAAPGNPFDGSTGLTQIWAYGLRNPWRFSFDRLTHDLYIGDVGQNAYEEIDFAPASSGGGENYGWRAYEGNHVFDSDTVSLVPVHTAPIVEVPQGLSSAVLRNACAITGGYVYRGSAIPALQGAYLFGDYCSNDIAAFRRCGATTGTPIRLADLNGEAQGLSSFGEDNDGELYLVSLEDGTVLRIIPAP